MSDFDDYLSLVERLGAGGINRSENDLSSNLKSALGSFGLHGVVDTGAGTNRVKRPDIALYADADAADIGTAADVVIEAKRPSELAAFASLKEALIGNELWDDKFVPYVAAHADRVIYFILTTFERFLVVPITAATRRQVLDLSSRRDMRTRDAALSNSLSFDLTKPGGANDWSVWCRLHLTPEALAPPALSEISDLRTITGSDELEAFAGALADVVVGPGAAATPGGTLLATIRLVSSKVEDLPTETHRGLII